MIKLKLYKTDTDKELFYYFNAKKEKMYMYRHRYYDNLGNRRERSKQGFTNEKIAYRELLEVKSKTLSGDIRQIENENLTVAQWLDIWYETHEREWEVSTQIQRANAIKHQMKPLLGKYKLNELTKSTYVRAYINKLLKKYKPSTVALFHTLFKIAVNAAVDDEVIARNRFSKITIEQNERRDNFLTPKELNIFLSLAAEEDNITNYTITLLLAYTGLRVGEAMALKWKNIDFKKKTLSVTHTRDTKGYRSPKTKRSVRTILIDDLLINQLKKYQTWCVKTKLSFGMQLDKENDFLFISHQTGNASGPVTIKYFFDRIYKRLKTKNEKLKQDGSEEIKLNRITPHGLRHTHATILISNKVPPQTIAKRLGNTVQMIYEIYAHSFEELEEESVQIFSDSLTNAGGDSGGGF